MQSVFISFLLLAMVLGLGACSQVPPPRFGTNSLISKKASSSSCSPTCFLLEAPSALEFVLSLKGEDASRVYDSLAIESQNATKKANQFECTKNGVDIPVCTFRIHAADGEIPVVTPLESLIKSKPKLGVNENYSSAYILQSPNGDGSMVTMTILLDYAKQIYANLTQIPEMPPQKGELFYDEKQQYDLNLLKKGKNINCLYQLKKVDPKNLKLNPVPEFTCKITFTTLQGSVFKN